MDINLLEDLVLLAKNGDIKSKEAIIKEFTPYIISMSKKTFIPGFDYGDINNECFISLLYAIKLYDGNKNTRFVYYALSSIKNNLNYLIKKQLRLSKPNGNSLVDFDFENISTNNIEDYLHDRNNTELINNINSSLNKDERELFNFLFVNNKSLSEYAYEHNISYNYSYKKKNKLQNKIKDLYSKEYLN